MSEEDEPNWYEWYVGYRRWIENALRWHLASGPYLIRDLRAKQRMWDNDHG